MERKTLELNTLKKEKPELRIFELVRHELKRAKLNSEKGYSIGTNETLKRNEIRQEYQKLAGRGEIAKPEMYEFMKKYEICFNGSESK